MGWLYRNGDLTDLGLALASLGICAAIILYAAVML